METRQGLPRLVQLFPNDNSVGDTTVDIIAVHGIETHSPRTWIAYEHDEEPRGRATNWLCDEDMLPRVVPQARIWAYDYNSNCYSDNAQEVDILGLGDSFLEVLRVAQDVGVGKRVLVFIGSCFGGIVIAQALERAFRDRARYYRLLTSTAGVVFLGTPLRGTATASIVQWLVLIRGFMGKETSATLIEGLKEKDRSLNNVIQDFAERVIQNQVQIRCFYETRETKIANAVASRCIAKFLPSVKLVSKESACLDGHKRIPLDATHPRMNKFHNSNDGGFKLVSGSLKELVNNALISQHRTEEELRCLRSLITSNYREDKDRNVQKVPKTCMWFLEHQTFLRWRQDLTARLLWVSADPGCGKSVLSRALVDDGLLKPNTSTTSVCYFFFKDDDSSRRNGANAICALLHQLFIQKPALLKYAMADFRNHGKHLRNMFSTLWDILEKSATESEAGEIICVLDALDECSTEAREKLIQLMSRFYSSRDKHHTKLKFLVTSRPYSDIERAFHREIEDMTLISLRGEDESETISREIDLVIDERLPRICGARRPPLEPEVQNLLISCLKKFEHRTYLWLHFVLDVIRDTLESTKFRLERLVNKLPHTVADAYEKMLRKIDEEQTQEARSLLHIVMAAVRPLTTGEMQIALAINEKLEYGEPCQSHEDLELQSDEAFRVKIRGLCGLFLSIVDSKVHLIHQTAKEFLISKNLNDRSATGDKSASEVWKHSLAPVESNLIILKICLSFLLFRKWDGERTFLEYAGQHWPAHYKSARITVERRDDSVMRPTLDVCEPQSYQFRASWEIYKCHSDAQFFTSSFSPSMRGSELRTSLFVASMIGLETVVMFLLERKSAKLDLRNSRYQTPLHLAAQYGHSEVIKLLIEKDGVELNLKDQYGQTPLHLALRHSDVNHSEVIKLLIEKDGVDLNLKDKNGQTPLHLAVERMHSEVINVLVEKNGLELNLKDNEGQTPLLLAATCGNSGAVEELLENDADMNLRDNHGQTPLHISAVSGYLEVVKLLLERNPELDVKDFDGTTALGYAVRNGHSEVVRLMIEKNARVDLVKIDGQTALSWAASHGRSKVVRVLLEMQGLEFDFDEGWDQPLSARKRVLERWALKLWARSKGYIDI